MLLLLPPPVTHTVHTKTTHSNAPLPTHTHQQEGAARPEIVAEVASSLADMLYATNKMAEAKDALQVCQTWL